MKVIQWQINIAAYHNWLSAREHWLGEGLLLDQPTVKNAITLALLDGQGSYLTYADLNEIFCQKGLVTKDKRESGRGIPIATLRVAISELARRLDRKGHYLQLKSERNGKIVHFALVDRAQTIEQDSSSFRNPDEPLIQPKDITRRLVQDGGGLPFASSYCCARAAAHWLHFSSVQVNSKRHYEAAAFDGYELHKELGFRGHSGDLGIVSLATGEGLGEVDLLERLLRDEKKPRPRRIQYAAIDTSEFLLTAHSQIIRERFSREINEGILTFAPLVGNLYQLKRCLSKIRFKLGKDYLRGTPLLFTYFGNCLGNYENHEWDFFRSITDAFPGVPLSILVGVSLLRRKGDKLTSPPIEEKYYTLESFYLETPRHLMYDLRLLFSQSEGGKRIPMNHSMEFKNEGKIPIPSKPYDTTDGISGNVYRFYYELCHDLVTWDEKQRLRAGSKLLLYSIVKYDLVSLKNFLETRGFKVSSPPSHYHIQRILDGKEDYRYAVFSASIGSA